MKFPQRFHFKWIKQELDKFRRFEIIEKIRRNFRAITWDELQFAVYKEDAVTPEDFLVRRTALFYEAPDQGLECLEAVADQMAQWFNWSESTREQHVAEYRSMVHTSRAWKTDPKKVAT